MDSWGGFGDWLALDGSGKTEGGTPRDLIGTALYAYDAELMAKTARVLGKESEAAAYEALHAKIVQAFQDSLHHEERLDVSRHPDRLRPRASFRTHAPEEGRANAVKELVRTSRKHGFHLATGFVGTPTFSTCSRDNGHLDLAYKPFSSRRRSLPGFSRSRTGPPPSGSAGMAGRPRKVFRQRHELIQSLRLRRCGRMDVVAAVAGLDLDPADPGYGTIVFRPRPGGTITHAEARLQTPRGEAGIRWNLKDGALEVELTVPEGAKGRFSAPKGFTLDCGELQAGVHKLTAQPE